MTHIGHSGKVLVMRVFIAVLVLIFGFQFWTKADDIRDLEIEGMSIGDSALNFFSEEKINNNKQMYFKSNKYTPIEIQNLSTFETYEVVAFSFKTGDSNYKIESLAGHLDYPNNISDCEKKLDKIVLDLDSLFENVAIKTEKQTVRQTINEPNDTKKVYVAYWFDTEDNISGALQTVLILFVHFLHLLGASS